MNTAFCNSLSAHYFSVITAVALLVFPGVSQAQRNTATGINALHSNTMGSDNTADGYYALFANTRGSRNTANGSDALYSNTTGSDNTADGYYALFSNTTGSNNTANGSIALCFNTTGSWNTTDGSYALYTNTTGNSNTANGSGSLYYNTTGSDNTAIGSGALYANTTGSWNIALGVSSGQYNTTGSSNIAIGNYGSATDTGVIRIGMTGFQKTAYIAGISGVTASGGVAVYINANGQLGTLTSSRRFKKDIHDIGSVSEKLLKLHPVTFRYKQAADDGSHPLQYGLIAEEVAKVYPELVQYDKQGKPFTVYYHLLTPMILSELQNEHRRNLTMKATHQTAVAALNAKIAALNVAHNTEITALKAELAVLKESQQQQLKMLAKLAAVVQTAQNKGSLQKAVFIPR